ncbi:Magnetosome protein MamI [Candidatus Magnetaquicoccaceae bacterium FCR-1]|uniref:Magnetosome protein MamI n=1 Tax=Candidatus Magnetaquiglobus chichijimensis TaxID=3141448 RepID=A0ABQ0CAF7_9PROT
MPKIVFGLIAIALGLWGVSTWWWSIVELLRGLVPMALLILGVVSLGAGVTKIKKEQPAAPMDAELSESSSQSDE